MALFGARARGRLRKQVERQLKESAAWKVTVHGKWICPYCVTLAFKIEGAKPSADEVLDHLDDCAEFAGGEGAERPLQELRKLKATREIRRMVKNQLVNNPSWQLIDFSQRWFCAYCGDPTNVTVPKDRKMTEETLQGIIGHVQSCYAYDRGKGKEKPFAHLKAIVRYQNQSRKLAENVRGKLEGDPAWRRKDATGCWICPYCMVAQEHIDLSSNLLMFENAPGLIAKHLAASCEQFKAGAKPAPLQRSSGSNQGALPIEPKEAPSGIGARTGSAILKDEDIFAGDDDSKIELGTDRWGQVKDPKESPTGRYRSTLWGKDGVPAQVRKEREQGTTLRQMEESGEFTLIDDSDLRGLRGGASDAGDKPNKPKKDRAERVESWRREIEEQLASVRSGALGRSGEINFNESRSGEEADPDLEASLRLQLPRRGLELRRVEFRAKPPGADFIDVIEFGSDRMALVAGGVAGDESEAPLISAMVRNLIRRHAAPNLCPSKVLRRVNAEIYSELDGRSLVQVSYSLFDLDSCRARLARAGLSAPVLMNVARQPSPMPLDSEGMVMGIDQGAIFDTSLEVRSLALEPGDLFVLFTKGVIEARGGSKREEFGVYRMHQLVQRYGTHELAYFADKFKEYFGLHIQQRRKQADGCVLALRRLPAHELQAV